MAVRETSACRGLEVIHLYRARIHAQIKIADCAIKPVKSILLLLRCQVSNTYSGPPSILHHASTLCSSSVILSSTHRSSQSVNCPPLSQIFPQPNSPDTSTIMDILTNGTANGVNGSQKAKPTFLFTSESVGEGHPDKIAYVLKSCAHLERGLPQVRT